MEVRRNPLLSLRPFPFPFESYFEMADETHF